MKKTFPLLTAFLLTTLLSSAQEPQTWWMAADLGYGRTLSESGKYSLGNPAVKQEMFGLNLMLGYNLNQRLSLGVGVAPVIYTNLDFITIPVLLDVRYRIPALRGTFAFANVGIPLTAKIESTVIDDMMDVNHLDYRLGAFATLGVGYRLSLSKRWALRAAAGYQVFPFAVDISYRDTWQPDTRVKQGLLLNFGVEYSFARY